MKEKNCERPIEVSETSYLDRFARGARSSYLRALVDERLVSCREALMILDGLGAAPAEELIADADRPARKQTVSRELRDGARAAADLLADECERTGLAASQLVVLLRSGLCA